LKLKGLFIHNVLNTQRNGVCCGGQAVR